MRKTVTLSLKYGKNKLNTIDKAYHWYIGLLPVLIVYNFPILNFSLGTVLLLMFVPHALLYIVTNVKKTKKISIIPLMIFYVYLCTRADGDINTYIINIAAIIHFGAIISGALQGEYIRKIMVQFAIFNTGLVLVQVLFHYIMRMDLYFVGFSMLQRDFALTYTQAISSSSLFRPTAMFLEPAFFSQYCLFAIISLLFPQDGLVNIKKVGAIALGIVATTSGMGIVLTVFVFGWYVLINRQKLGSKIVSIFKWTVIVFIILLILSCIPFFQQAMMRVFSNLDGYNALTGRTGNWQRALDGMVGMDLWIGYGRSVRYPFYLSGVPYMVYYYGLIGIGLELGFIFYIMLKKRNNFVWCTSVVFVGLLCVAQIVSVYLQLFYFSLLITEAIISNQRKSFHA